MQCSARVLRWCRCRPARSARLVLRFHLSLFHFFLRLYLIFYFFRRCGDEWGKHKDALPRATRADVDFSFFCLPACRFSVFDAQAR